MAVETEKRELNEYQKRNIHLLSHLIDYDAVDEQIVEHLHQSELDYFSLLEKIRLLELRANIDEKTSLLKYRKSYLSSIVKMASRIYHGMDGVDYSVSLVRFDIDDFSRFNNKYGHDVGDKVLLSIARTIKELSRPTDYVIRFGGEEIDVILPATNLIGAETYVSKLMDKIREIRITHGNDTLSVTVSAGLSCRTIGVNALLCIRDEEIERLYTEIQCEADDALYEAKSSGKNRFCIYSKERKDIYRSCRREYEKNS